VPQFPPDLLETTDSPNIYITSPTTSTASSRFPPPLSMNMNMMHSLNSPNSSPTTPDFQGGYHHHHHQQQQQHAHHPHHQQLPHHHPHSTSRFQGGGGGSGYSRTGDSTSSTPLPSSPGSISMELFDDGSCDPPPSGRPSTKRQRLDDGVGVGVGVNGINTGGVIGGIGGLVGGGGGNASDSMSLLSSVSSPGSGNGLATLTVPKKSSRARSDSAPLGYGGTSGLGTTMHSSWQQQQQQQQGGMGASGGPVGGQGNGSGGGQGSSGGMGRPRSGSGMVSRIGIPNMGRTGNGSTPLLSITTVESDMGGHPR